MQAFYASSFSVHDCSLSFGLVAGIRADSKALCVLVRVFQSGPKLSKVERQISVKMVKPSVVSFSMHAAAHASPIRPNQSFVNPTYFLINISKNIYRRVPNYGSF